MASHEGEHSKASQKCLGSSIEDIEVKRLYEKRRDDHMTNRKLRKK